MVDISTLGVANKLFASIGSGAAAPLQAALNAGVTCAIGVQGDSTGAYPNATLPTTYTWPYLLGQVAAAKYPNLRVVYKPWDPTGEVNYTADYVIQEQSAGPRYCSFTTGGYTVAAGSDGTSSRTALSGQEMHLTGDFDFSVLVLPDWYATSIDTGTDQVLLARYGSGGTQFEFAIRGTSAGANSGKLSLRWTTDGSTFGSNRVSTVVPTWSSTPMWIRVTLAIASGTTTFYTSTDGFTWTQLGSTVVTGATTPYDSTNIIELGGYGWSSAAGQFKGKVYEVRVRNGISGPLVAPAIPDRWQRYPNTPNESQFGGAQTLYIVNGSRAGQGVTYLSDSTRFPKMTPNYGQLLHIYNTSHNESNLVGEALLAKWDAWHALVVARLPLTSEMVLTQNPHLAALGGNWLREQIVRPHQLMGWAQRKGIGYVDTSTVFLQDPRGLAALMQDGVHPTYTDGQRLMVNTIAPFVFGGLGTTTATAV